VEVEFEAYAEHEQDDAHFGELLGDLEVGGEARRVRADGHAGEEEADHRGESQSVGEVAQDQRRGHGGGESQHDIIAHHPSW
jgi:hypothetical protein